MMIWIGSYNDANNFASLYHICAYHIFEKMSRKINSFPNVEDKLYELYLNI